MIGIYELPHLQLLLNRTLGRGSQNALDPTSRIYIVQHSEPILLRMSKKGVARGWSYSGEGRR